MRIDLKYLRTIKRNKIRSYTFQIKTSMDNIQKGDNEIEVQSKTLNCT